MMTPRLAMMTTFAAASLQGRLAGRIMSENHTVHEAAWADALAMMHNMPEKALEQLRTADRAFANGGNPYPDQG